MPREFVLTTLEGVGLKAVDLFSLSSPLIAVAMLIVMAVIGLMGPRTRNLALTPSLCRAITDRAIRSTVFLLSSRAAGSVPRCRLEEASAQKGDVR